jgi:hypothetical protein
MSYTPQQENAIAAANAATAAATLLQGTGATIEQFEATRTAIFEGTRRLAGSSPAQSVAEAVTQVTETFPGAQVVTPAPAPAAPSGGNSDAGSLEIRMGKFKGKTIAQAHAADSRYVEEFLTSIDNEFLKGKVNEYLASLAAA